MYQVCYNMADMDSIILLQNFKLQTFHENIIQFSLLLLTMISP